MEPLVPNSTLRGSFFLSWRYAFTVAAPAFPDSNSLRATPAQESPPGTRLDSVHCTPVILAICLLASPKLLALSGLPTGTLARSPCVMPEGSSRSPQAAIARPSRIVNPTRVGEWFGNLRGRKMVNF